MFDIKFVIEIEKKYNLPERTFLGLKIYQLLREYIVNDLPSVDKGLNFVCETFTPNKKDYVINNKYKNLYKITSKDKSDILFITDHRRILQGDKYESIYIDEFNDLIKDKYSTITLEQPSWACFIKNKNTHYFNHMSGKIKYLDIIEKNTYEKIKMFKRLNKLKYKKIKQEIKNLIDIFIKELNIDLSCHQQFYIDNFLYFYLSKEYYEKILDYINPKCAIVFYRAFPAKVMLIYLLKSRGVQTIEVQHGTFYKNYPVNQMADSNIDWKIKPNYLFAFGNMQIDFSNLRYKKDQVKFTGNLFLNKKINENYIYPSEISTENKYVLVISQNVIGEELSNMISEISKKINDKNLRILYRYHPQEINKNYVSLNLNNIVQSKSITDEIYRYQKHAVAQIGVFSTAIFEGLAFGLPTIILPCGGEIADVKSTLKKFKQGIYFPKTIDEAVDILNSHLDRPLQEDIDMLWESNPKEKFLRELDEVLKKK